MVTTKSVDFIAGYLFNKMEKRVFKHITISNDVLRDSQVVPKSWFGLTSHHDPNNDIVAEIKHELKEQLEKAMNELFIKWEIDVIRITPERQYISFDYVVHKKEEVKKMTVAEIEKALGYKIEIISKEN